MKPRRPLKLDEMTPEQRAAVEAIRARYRSPEYREEEARIRAAVRKEFPPASARPGVTADLPDQEPSRPTTKD